MLSRFFIDRPIFASVLSIVITLAGGISVFTLPLAQFPQVTPPTVNVTCTYPGASALEVADSVAAPIEQQVNGVEGIMYMNSQCANDGSYSLTVTFQHGVDINMANVLVQNRVNLAVPLLPEVIRQTGVTTRKRSPDILMGMAITSPDDRYDQLYLSNFALMQVKDELARLPGVGDVFLFGQRDYSMRIWVDPAKLSSRGMSATDVVRAIREQNSQVATGAVGQQPMFDGQMSQITLSTLGRLSEPEQFENIVVKVGVNGRLTRIKDIGWVELNAKNQDIRVRIDGHDTVFLAIFQTPDANAIDLRARLLGKMDELKQGFPEGVDYDIGFDTTPYTSESIKEVWKALLDSIVLVAVVVLLFLQNWRSSIIPLVAVPVAIIGTFAVMAAIGFSLNNLTLFGLVLAIGIVVDDAIVVVEAVEHHIENGLAPREATIAAMRQVSGPVIAVGLVLSAVFVPCAFISGITGQFFRQFAMTIAVSTIISAFNSLTLSPALTAVLLRPHDKEAAPPLPWLAFPLAGGWLGWTFLTPWLARGAAGLPDNIALVQAHSVWLSPTVALLVGAALAYVVGPPLNRLLGTMFRAFNAGFARTTNGYVRLVGGLLRVSTVVLVVYGGLVLVTFWQFQQTPRGFIPAQDMGYLFVNVQLPDSASIERTDKVMRKIEEIALKLPGIKHVSGIAGQSFVLNASGSNFGTLFVNLKDYALRRDPGDSSEAIANTLRQEFGKQIMGAQVAVFGPPPVRGVGRAGGFALMLEDRGDIGPAGLQEQTENLVRKGNATPGLLGMFSVYRANVPRLQIAANSAACMVRGVSLQDFADTLGIYEGSLYVNDFNLFGRTWQVIVQADSDFRRNPEDLGQLRVRSSRGQMVPIGSLATQHEVNGPLVLSRYNMYPAAAINGGLPLAWSQGETMGRPRAPRQFRTSAQHGLRVDGHVISRTARGEHRHDDLRVRRGDGLSDAGGAVRKLVAPAGSDSGRSHVPLERADGGEYGAHGHEHLHADRVRRFGGAGEQERRFFIVEFRQTSASRRPVAARGDAQRLQIAVAADRDDVARLHSGRAAPDGLARGRGRDAPHAGDGGLQRNAGSDAVRHCLDAGLFLYDRPAGKRVALVRPGRECNPPAPWHRPHLLGRSSAARKVPASPAWPQRGLSKNPAVTKTEPSCPRTPPSNGSGVACNGCHHRI